MVTMSTWPRDPVTKRFLKRSEMPPVDVRVTDNEPLPPVNRRLTLADLGRIADEANARVEAARKAFEAAELELSEAENAATVAVAALKVKL